MDKLKVLVVATLGEMGGFISAVLNKKGFDATVSDPSCGTRTYAEILRELSQRNYDMILLTNNGFMPSHIRVLVPEIREKYPAIKILVSSGSEWNPEFIRDLEERGIDDFLPIPFKIDDLVQKVTSIFAKENKKNKIKKVQIPYKQGDFIGGQKYEVCNVLGMGGCGIVYLVYSHQTKQVYALKTFRDEYLDDGATRGRFRKEAQVWIDLDRHPYLVRAYHVEEISGRFFIALEYIAPDERGLNSLEGYLNRQPPDLPQSLRWAVQFCYGMEYAYFKGICAHRDIKPANIMISREKVVKISDFGLAGVIGTSKAISGIKLGIQKERIGLSFQTMEGTGFGTPTHMPPEQFTNAVSCDERSDIYSFGIVLYQMATSGKLPFLAPLPRDNSEEESKRFWIQMYMLHSEAPLPKVNSPLFPVAQRCLEKESHERYRSFKELRLDLEKLLKRGTGEVFKPPELKELGVQEWLNKGRSFDTLGRFDEASACNAKAFEISRSRRALLDEGVRLNKLGRFDEAIAHYDKALEIDPQYIAAWLSKGACLHSLGRFDEEISCLNKALEVDPPNANAWVIGGVILESLGRFDEALTCFNRALKIDPQCTEAWNNKGKSLHRLGRFDEALTCFNRALEIDPTEALTWYLKALVEKEIHREQDAIHSFQQFIEHAHGQYPAEVDGARQQLRELEK